MAKKKACKFCKVFVEESACPNCKSSQFVLNWRGRLTILDAAKSEIAKKTGIAASGEYAIKVS